MLNYIANKEALLRYEKKFKITSIIVSILLLIIIVFFVLINKYDQVSLKAFITCQDKCSITFPSQLSDVNYLSNGELIIISGHQYKVLNVTISDIINNYEELTSYQEVTYEIENNSLPSNQIIDITILQNKEKLYQKFNPFK